MAGAGLLHIHPSLAIDTIIVGIGLLELKCNSLSHPPLFDGAKIKQRCAL
jgi:hypothetical protein